MNYSFYSTPEQDHQNLNESEVEHLDEQEIQQLQKLNELNDYIETTLQKLDTIQKIKILLTLINYGTKFFALYSCYFEFEMFSQNTLLLFSYLLYALLELVALASAIAFILTAKVINFLFRLHTYYMDSMICLPILYNVFRFCLIVTFLVQSIALFVFAKFNHWGYQLFLATSLLLILVLEFLRIILMCGGKLALTSHCCEIDSLFHKILNKKYLKSVSIAKFLFSKVYKIYFNLNPDMKRRIRLAVQMKDKVIELKDNYNWVKTKFSKKRDFRSQSIKQTIEMNSINAQQQPTSASNANVENFEQA